MNSGTVYVTGASRGIGLEVCRVLLDQGYTVVATARTATTAFRSLADEHPGRAVFHQADLCAPSDLTELASRIRACSDLRGLVNNAGAAAAGLHVGLPADRWDTMWSLNVRAPMMLCQAAAKSMRRGRTGRIVNVSSVSANKTYRGLGVYTATKAALEGFSRVLAAEVGAWGITVNCVAPGFISTEMTSSIPDALKERIINRNALGSPPTVGDVARAVDFLMSDGASAITAQVIRVDAGAAG